MLLKILVILFFEHIFTLYYNIIVFYSHKDLSLGYFVHPSPLPPELDLKGSDIFFFEFLKKYY